MRSRALTQTVVRPNVTLMVEEFRCQSHSYSHALGTAAAHRSWKVKALGHGTEDEEMPDLAQAAAPEQVRQEAESINRVLRTVQMEVVTDAGVGGMRGTVMGTRVQITADGKQLWPEPGRDKEKARLNDDWSKIWKFRSLYPGVGLVRPGELWVPGTIPTEVPSKAGEGAHFLQTRVMGDGQLNTMHEVQAGHERLPAVLREQWPNGTFKVMAFRRDERGVWRECEFPTLHKSNIFLTATGENIDLPELEVALELPKGSPNMSSVIVEGDHFSYHLGRVSPPEKQQARRIEVNCPKPVYRDAKMRVQQSVMGAAGIPVMPQEEPIQMNCPAAALDHFLSGQVRRGDMNGGRLQKDWLLQLGPFAIHSVRLVKNSHTNAVMTVYVDNEVLVECMATDLMGGDPNVFRCRFSLTGERLMDFIVFEETKDGFPLDSRGVVTKPYQYSHVVELTYPHKAIDNLVEATMTVDGLPFERLPTILQERRDSPGLNITRTALEAQFPIRVPRKVRPEDTRNIGLQLADKMVENAGGWGAIGQRAQDNAAVAGQNAAVAGSNFAKTMEDVGSNLQKLGLSAWESMFLQRGVNSTSQPAQPVSGRPHSSSICDEGPIHQPVRTMPNRGVMSQQYPQPRGVPPPGYYSGGMPRQGNVSL
jgi:hypothetical protein